MAPATTTALIPGSPTQSQSQQQQTTAVDIITYIGIPLAVLGVLPTLYTCLKSLLTLRTIRRLLIQNHIHDAITRSSLLSGIIELELPRRSLIPLDRADPNYFKLGTRPSSLKGGSWTSLNFRALTIGVKSYRLQYHDELCQPAAEINFEALVAYLLDLGAIPDPRGWEDLHSSGLWCPAGTKLMLAPLGAGGRDEQAVLWVGTSEDSDGILSLGCMWRADWATRRVEDLPPYWMRIGAPGDTESMGVVVVEDADQDPVSDEKDMIELNTLAEKKTDIKTEVTRADTDDTLHENDSDVRDGGVSPKQTTDQTRLHPSDAHRHSLFVPSPRHSSTHKRSFSKTSARSSLSMMSVQPHSTSALRIKLGASGLEEASYESGPTKKIRLPHLSILHQQQGTRNSRYSYTSFHGLPGPVGTDSSSTPTSSSTSAPTWFATAATAYANIASTSSGTHSLWSYTIPTPILTLSHRDTIPSGILVLLSLLPPSACPNISLSLGDPAPDSAAAKMAQHEAWVSSQKRMKRQMEQAKMTPAERAAAFHRDFMADQFERQEAARRKAVLEEARKEEMLREALGSQRVGLGLVAEVGVKWLASEEGRSADDGPEEDVVLTFPSCSPSQSPTAAQVVHIILHTMIHSPTFAANLAKMLDLWAQWADGGGMTVSHFEHIKKEMRMFIHAACVLSLVRNATMGGGGENGVVGDLAGCLRGWRKVRLG